MENKIDKKKQGKRNRAKGASFERKTRADLELQGYFASKFQSNVDLEENKLVPAKASRFRLSSTGFPDFMVWSNLPIIYEIDTEMTPREVEKFKKELIKINKHPPNQVILEPNVKVAPTRTIIGVECKVQGYLSKEEKEKCQWLLNNRVFDKILIAYEVKEGRKKVVKYKTFEDYINNKRGKKNGRNE